MAKLMLKHRYLAREREDLEDQKKDDGEEYEVCRALHAEQFSREDGDPRKCSEQDEHKGKEYPIKRIFDLHLRLADLAQHIDHQRDGADKKEDPECDRHILTSSF